MVNPKIIGLKNNASENKTLIIEQLSFVSVLRMVHKRKNAIIQYHEHCTRLKQKAHFPFKLTGVPVNDVDFAKRWRY